MNISGINTNGFYLEAEITPNRQDDFQDRYHKATGTSVTTGSHPSYQQQSNKWGAELRVYFNDESARTHFESNGINVEANRSGYKSGEYSYRVNNNDVWWELVETVGLRLGSN